MCHQIVGFSVDVEVILPYAASAGACFVILAGSIRVEAIFCRVVKDWI
jgi:hypothetical protein